MKEHGIIFRTALLQKMKEKSAKQNLYMAAPGGYGKTVATTQLFTLVRGSVSHLTMSGSDNDPAVFYRRLSCSLLKLTAKINSVPEAEYALDGLLETLQHLPEKNPRCYLALDDLHMIHNKELLNSLPLIVSRLPGYVCLCLISRADPSASLLETGRFAVFKTDSLLFSPDEIEWLGEEKDYRLTSAQITELHERTGGWAMYLSAILSSGKKHLAPEEGNKPKTLLQYLDARVWGLWDKDTKNLLLRLSIPNEVTPELCERLLGCPDGQKVLGQLMETENAFLSYADGDAYRFHDIFRDFLLERANRLLGSDEMRRLHDITAGWYYERGDYFSGVRHYIYNRDHNGITRCLRQSNRYHVESGNLSVETSLHFTTQYILTLPSEFIAENPYLIAECAIVEFHNGNTECFLRYTDMLYARLPDIAAKYPDLMESVGFIGGLDYRTPLKDYAAQIVEMMPHMLRAVAPEANASSNTITQNMPFFHRSMRDFSEYHELHEDDMMLLRDTFGVMIGKDYTAMEQALMAGIYYERGELLNAVHHAVNGWRLCDESMQPETVFSVSMILAAILTAMGAAGEAKNIMTQTQTFIEQKARFLLNNFKAIQTHIAIRAGDSSAAQEWLELSAHHSERLPFYQMCRHFATLRSYIARNDYKKAIKFGNKLLALARAYHRPIDQMESGLLTAIALWNDDEKNKAIKRLEQTVNIAMPYGFAQLFINEGKTILPLLWALRDKSVTGGAFVSFIDRLTGMIYTEHDFEPAKEQSIQLTEKQRTMLLYLSKDISYQYIADELGIGRGTVKTHILQLYKRLGVHNAQEAIVKAKALGLF